MNDTVSGAVPVEGVASNAAVGGCCTTVSLTFMVSVAVSVPAAFDTVSVTV